MPVFNLEPVEEVHLHSAPLAKVLMQVQFSRTPHLVSEVGDDLIADLLGRYPVRRRQVNTGVGQLVINGQALPIPPGSSAPILTFSEPTGAWIVTLTEGSVALETSEYMSRDDFCERALEVFRAVASAALPPVVDRLGLRYIDRLSGAALKRVPEYVIPELLVLYGRTDRGLAVRHSISDSLIEISASDCMQVRTGILPAGAGFDPALPSLPEPSWVLDMDVFSAQGGFPFEPNELAARLRTYAEAAYSFFRFATTDIFQADHIADNATTSEDFR
jgi:uncharacterized protein (TIGR04255 family)